MIESHMNSKLLKMKLSAILCLARAIFIWCNEIVPALVAWRTQERLRPTVSFITKQMPRRPMMIFGTISAAHLALVSLVSWLYLARINACRHNQLLWDEVRCSIAAVAHEKVLNRSTLVFAFNNLPGFMPSTFWAWIVRPFKGFFCHEKLSILR